MGIPHKAFNFKLIIINACFFVNFFTIFLISSIAHAYDASLFIVEGIKVDVTAEDAVSAQEKAFSRAQQKAFEILAERMVSESDVSSIEQVDMGIISSMINDYEVKNEQVSAVRYLGEFTFRFDPKSVGKYFSVSGVQYTDTKSKPLLVLPVFKTDGNNTIWGTNNLWMQSWSKVKLPPALVPVEVPIGDLDDVADINDDNALRYERKNLDRMLLRYNAKEAAIMIAVPDQELDSHKSLDDMAGGTLRISIYRTDRGRAEYVSDIDVVSYDQESVGGIYERAVLESYNALQKNWKIRTAASSAQSRLYHVRMPVKGLKDLVRKKNSLVSIPGMSNINVVSVKPSEAIMVLTFRGDEERLRSSLSGSYLSLGRAYRVGGNGSGQVIYDLFEGNSSRSIRNYGYRDTQENSGVYQSGYKREEVNDPNVHTF